MPAVVQFQIVLRKPEGTFFLDPRQFGREPLAVAGLVLVAPDAQTFREIDLAPPNDIEKNIAPFFVPGNARALAECVVGDLVVVDFVPWWVST